MFLEGEDEDKMVTQGTRLQKIEQMIFDLRDMYANYGYSQFKIRKFEEYELYVKNKDFLDSVNIITFTDTNGRLMALKPDVTLSVVKNCRDIPGIVQKVYYNENIYRVSRRSHMFQELTQVGIEAIGDIDDYNICEVLALAAASLKHISPDSLLIVSDLDILSAILNEPCIAEEVTEDIIACLGEKNVHTLRRICEENDVDDTRTDLLIQLSKTYGRPENVLPKLEVLAKELEDTSGKSNGSANAAIQMAETIRERAAHLAAIVDGIEDPALKEIVRIDFSVVSDVNYYNGIVFNGFVEGLPECIISGGQYDRLMKKMKRSSRAIGFGVYMDRMEHFLADNIEYDIDIVLLYEDDAETSDLRRTVNQLISAGNSVLAQRSVPDKIKYRKLMRFEKGEVKEIE